MWAGDDMTICSPSRLKDGGSITTFPKRVALYPSHISHGVKSASHD